MYIHQPNGTRDDEFPLKQATPERSLAQRMEALQRANEIRSHRAQLKRDLKSGRTSIVQLLDARRSTC